MVPAVNDPGTAIGIIIATLARLLSTRADAHTQKNATNTEATHGKYDRVRVALVSPRDLFDDAFTAIVCDAAQVHATLPLPRAELALSLAQDLAALRQAASAGMLRQ